MRTNKFYSSLSGKFEKKTMKDFAIFYWYLMYLKNLERDTYKIMVSALVIV